jgi:hypothetical protein
LWDSVSVLHDLDDTRQAAYGVYCTHQKPSASVKPKGEGAIIVSESKHVKVEALGGKVYSGNLEGIGRKLTGLFTLTVLTVCLLSASIRCKNPAAAAELHTALYPGDGSDLESQAGLEWRTETLDCADSVTDSSLAVDHDGYPHVSYKLYDYGERWGITYTYKDGTGWHDHWTKWASSPSIAIGPDGLARIAHKVLNYGPGSRLLYGSWVPGNGWDTSKVHYTTSDTVFRDTVLMLDADTPHIAYEYDHSVWYAFRDADGWDMLFPTDSGIYTTNSPVDLGMRSDGLPCMLFRHSAPQGIFAKLACCDRADYMDLHVYKWPIVWEEGGSGTSSSISMAIDDDDNAHIAYYDREYVSGSRVYTLMYVRQDGPDEWRYEQVDHLPDDRDVVWSEIAARLELDTEGYPHIAYGNTIDGGVRYAFKDSTGWYTQTVSAMQIRWGNTLDLTLDGQNRPHIVYSITDGSLCCMRYARLAPSLDFACHIPFVVRQSN